VLARRQHAQQPVAPDLELAEILIADLTAWPAEVGMPASAPAAPGERVKIRERAMLALEVGELALAFPVLNIYDQKPRPRPGRDSPAEVVAVLLNPRLDLLGIV
jgi:hypothetical protein